MWSTAICVTSNARQTADGLLGRHGSLNCSKFDDHKCKHTCFFFNWSARYRVGMENQKWWSNDVFASINRGHPKLGYIACRSNTRFLTVAEGNSGNQRRSWGGKSWIPISQRAWMSNIEYCVCSYFGSSLIVLSACGKLTHREVIPSMSCNETAGEATIVLSSSLAILCKSMNMVHFCRLSQVVFDKLQSCSHYTPAITPIAAQ